MSAESAQEKKPDIAAVLMGEPWLELEWRKSLAMRIEEQTFKPKKGEGGGGGESGPHSARRYGYRLTPSQRIKNAFRAPQAVVKIIKGGGVGNGSDLRAQLDYLSREGELGLEEADGEFRNGIDDREDIKAIVREWAADWRRAAKEDGRFARSNSKTFHLLVSFPHGTDVEKAERAANGFADKLCHSGEFGDQWRNIRAWHTDRDHPHMHLIIDRRGESGRMMKIHPAAEINPGVLRALQVDTAAEQGLALNDTPRASRGFRGPSFSSPEWRTERRGSRRGRLAYRQRYAELARGFAEDAALREATAQRELASALRFAPESAKIVRELERAAETLEQGKEIGTMDAAEAREMTPDKIAAMDVATLEETVRAAVEEGERVAVSLTDETERAELEAATGRIKSSFAHVVPEFEERSGHDRTDGLRPVVQGRDEVLVEIERIAPSGAGLRDALETDAADPDEDQTVRASGAREDGAEASDDSDRGFRTSPVDTLSEADARVAAAYQARGMNADRALARVRGGKDAEPETLNYWHNEEVKERMRVADVPRAVAEREIGDLHDYAAKTYKAAERAIGRDVALADSAARAPEDAARFRDGVEATDDAALVARETARSEDRQHLAAERAEDRAKAESDPMSEDALRAKRDAESRAMLARRKDRDGSRDEARNRGDERDLGPEGLDPEDLD